MSKWNQVRGSLTRAHNDLFDATYTADFYEHTGGSYDPNEGEITGETRGAIATGIAVEIVPPGMDTTVDTDGTSFSWDTSIRLPNESFTSRLVPLGVESAKPTEVEVVDETDSSVTVYELHGYSSERGSGMILARLVEQ